VWQSRWHFFGAAAQAMRRILVERARRRGRVRHGGAMGREPLRDDLPGVVETDVDMVGLDDALTRLEKHNPRVGQVVMLRYFAGLSIEDTASALAIGVTTVKDEWGYARAWLKREMGSQA
jgi:RNA polymerase sigma factor (TIGR02999 family)